MNVDISKIRFQDARILRVIENADQKRLTFEVSYPLTECNTDFEQGKFSFEFFSRYVVTERNFPGEPTIQKAEVTESTANGMTIRLHTNYGIREVSCYGITSGSTFVGPGAEPKQ